VIPTEVTVLGRSVHFKGAYEAMGTLSNL